MNKRDAEATASIFRGTYTETETSEEYEVVLNLAQLFAAMYGREIEGFSHKDFLTACGF